MTEVYRTELTPPSFLERSEMAYPTKTAIVHQDIIISGGENISTVHVERTIASPRPFWSVPSSPRPTRRGVSVPRPLSS